MVRVIKGAPNSMELVGNMVDIERDDHNALKFFLEYCNVTDIADQSAKVQVSRFPCVVSAGAKADKYEAMFDNGDVVLVRGINSQSEKNKTIKYRIHTIIPYAVVVKEA